MAASAAAPSSRPTFSISLEAVVRLGRLLLERIDELDEEVDGLDRELWTSARGHEETARLMAVPGIGPKYLTKLPPGLPTSGTSTYAITFPTIGGLSQPRG